MSLLLHSWKLAALVLVASFSAGVSAQTNGQPPQVRGLRGTYAPIHAGKVAVLGNPKQEQRFGVSSEVEFRKLNSGPSDYMDALKRKIGAGEITFVNVPDTLFSFILRDGVVQPVILEPETWEVWEVTGLGKYFSRCRSISPGQRGISFGGIEGLADIWPVWHFEFGDKDRGLVVKLTVDGGW